ncbi:MAG TPA: TonB-dependent receptor [Gammaproteobacteria bacterium]
MKHRYISLALLATLAQAAQAQDEPFAPNAAAENADKDQLLALLDEQTAIATRTRMNADYVPGMVTVLRGDDLEARGVRTVWEALALVPGMEMAIEKTGRRKVLVRGLGNTWASGNVKLLLNDICMNSAELGLADPVFNIAIEQVERIEVIRGPGSALYGEYGYMGVINVVTRADASRLFAFGGSFATAGGGATLAYASADSPLKASLNLAGWRSSGADVEMETDTLHYYGYQDYSYAPGPANEEVDAGTAVFKLDYQRFSFLAQQSQDGLGDHFGINEFLPPDADRIVERWRHRTVNMRQELPLTTALTAGLQMGWKEQVRSRDDLYVNPGDFATPHNPDVYLDSNYQETSLKFGTDFTYRGWSNHTALLAASGNSVRVDKSWITFSEPIGEAITIPEGTTRSITSVTLQDEYRHSDLFTLTTGVRYDNYSDVGVNYSPRIAGVWRLNEQHILKAQYAQAFRPPTLYELSNIAYFDSDLKPAKIKTSELGYIFKGMRAETRLTTFYSELDDLVVFSHESHAAYGNEGATATGLEWEQILRPAPHWLWDGNVSYVDTRDKESGEPFPGASQWIANLGPAYERGDAAVTLQAHYVSGYYREAHDPRPTLHGYTTVDLTSSFYHLLTRGLSVRFGIKNLFDADVRYPAAYNSYRDDLPRAGRSGWAQLSYRF